MPYCTEVDTLQKKVKGALTHQVGGVFTINACIQLLSGRLSCDLTPNGIGYNNWKTSKDSDGNISFNWDKALLPFFLEREGFKFVSRNILGLYLVYGLDKYSNISANSTTVMDRFDNNKWVLPARWSSEIAASILIGTGKPADQATEDEIKYVQKIQSTKATKPEFHFISYNHYHIACQWGFENAASLAETQGRAAKHLLRIMNSWDFEEDDALFWVFSDHGAWFHPSIDAYPLPNHYYVWSIIKDNTKIPSGPIPKTTSIQDFTPAIHNKIQGNDLFTDMPDDRIFLTEDGRAAIDASRMTTAIACQVISDTKISHTCYHLGDNSFLSRTTHLDDSGFVASTEPSKRCSEQEAALKQNFEWVL